MYNTMKNKKHMYVHSPYVYVIVYNYVKIK